jgi:hypothetical protein
MLDDDIIEIRRNYESTVKEIKIIEKNLIYPIICRTAELAELLGCYLWGFSNKRRPEIFHSETPILLKGYINNSFMGFNANHNLDYDVKMTEGEDHYINLLNKYKNRIHLLDERYSMLTDGNFKKAGGCQDYRSTEDMMKNTRYLQQVFGTEVVKQKRTAGDAKKNINLGERTVSTPF